MSNMYDDAKFGVIQRQWFLLRNKYGGQCATGAEFGSATTMTHVTRWYPRGPITLKKIGYLVQATLVGKATNKGRRRFTFYTRGASASIAGYVLPASAGTISQYTFNSSKTFTVDKVKAGEYMTIKSATPRTVKTTWALSTVVQGTVSGTLALFIDYVPKYGSEWDLP